MRVRKAKFSELLDALTVLCRAEKGAIYYSGLLSEAYEELSNLEELASCTRKDNPVIASLALQAIKAR